MNTPPDIYRLLADLVLVLHVGFVLFVVGGQLLVLLGWWRAWVWPRNPVFRVAHLAAIGVVVAEAWLGAMCPLTAWENALRALAGEGPYAASFIGYWLGRLLFYQAPEWVFVSVYTLFGALALASFTGYPPRTRRRDARGKTRDNTAP